MSRPDQPSPPQPGASPPHPGEWDRLGRTRRLELTDQTLRQWSATVLAADPDGGVVLDRSAFYPGGGGQPPDHGVLLWGGVQSRVVDTRKGDDLHLLVHPEDPLPPAGTVVRAAVEDERRTALMRTHSALHIVCGVVFRDFGALVTGSNMNPLEGRLDLNLETLPDGFKSHLNDAVSAEVAADRAVDVRVLPRAEALAVPDVIRTATNLIPAEVEVVRLVDINGLDVQADAGTHVASTRQVGAVEVVKVENKGRGFRRVRVRLPAGTG